MVKPHELRGFAVSSRGPLLSSGAGCASGPAQGLLLDGSALVDEAALEGPPGPAPVDDLLLGDGEVVGRGRLDLYAWKQERIGFVEPFGGDVHHVLAGHD